MQHIHLKQELNCLTKGKVLPKFSALVRFTPFIDSHGILHVGGRLHASFLSEEAKHSAILPRNSVLTTLIISDAHERTFHGETQLTSSFIREKFWILGGRAS